MADLTSQPRLILASSSPRRRQLLAEAGLQFQVVAPPLPEPNQQSEGLSPTEHAEALAYFKARAVADSHPGDVVLGADTVVAAASRLLGKADGAKQARAMLESLSGTRHQVITGVALLGPCGKRLITSDVTWVTMRKMTGREIQAYVDSGEWIGKAGAYAIQMTADRYVEKLEGSFSNVVGLPMELVTRLLRVLFPDLQAEAG